MRHGRSRESPKGSARAKARPKAQESLANNLAVNKISGIASKFRATILKALSENASKTNASIWGDLRFLGQLGGGTLGALILGDGRL